MKIKHSKYKNTGILFELLVRQITADTLKGGDSPAIDILKEYFVKTSLGREYKLYESVLKSKVFKFPNKNKKMSEISFGSKIRVLENKRKFFRFSKGWIYKSDLKPINYQEKNPFRNISIFKNIKYKWGGKSYKGIDCSALVQIFLNFNNKFCPRDAKDQVKFFKKNIKFKKIKKNDIIYWKGHVAVALSNKKLIHAYGPRKKTVVMGINQTIKKIEQTAKLKVIGIKAITKKAA